MTTVTLVNDSPFNNQTDKFNWTPPHLPLVDGDFAPPNWVQPPPQYWDEQPPETTQFIDDDEEEKLRLAASYVPEAYEILGNLTEDPYPKVYIYDAGTGFCFHDYQCNVDCNYPGCDRKTFLPPFCKKHDHHHGVEVLNSSQVPEQKGLFATQYFRFGAEVCLYGVRGVNSFTPDEWNDYQQTVYGPTGHPLYAFTDDKHNLTYDCALIRYPGAYANDARADNTKYRLEGVENNTCFQFNEHSCWLEATREINPGEEIFVDYGPDYWHSSRLDNTFFAIGRDIVPGWYEEVFADYHLQKAFEQCCQVTT